MKRINKEHIIGIFCILLGTIVLFLTRTFPKGAASNMQLTGPEFFPNVLSIILIIIGIYEIVYGFTLKSSEENLTAGQLWSEIQKPKSITIFIIIGMLIFFVIFLKKLGFFTTSFVFLFVILWRLKIVWWKNIITTMVFLAVIYLVFVKIFSTRLPSGILF